MATLKISELSVGDWVSFEDIYCKVEYILSDGIIGTTCRNYRDGYEDTLTNLRPIPITAEILEKNGFAKKNYDNGKMLDWCCDNILVRKFADEDFYRFIVAFNSEHYTTMMVVVKHTHQLQQSLRLAGVDKEINL